MEEITVKTCGFAEKPEDEVTTVLSLHSSSVVKFAHLPEMRDVVLKTAVEGIVVRTKMLAIIIPWVSEHRVAVRDISALTEHAVVACVEDGNVLSLAIGGKNFDPDFVEGVSDFAMEKV